MNTFSPICLLVCLATLTLAFFPRTKAQLPSEDDVPPSIVVHPTTLYGDKRLPLVLECRATGTPEPTYYWEKDGVLIDIENNDRASLDGGNLVIDPLEDSDNGVYQCFANNLLGTAMSKKITTSVAYMEQFEDTMPSTMNVRVGEPLSLRCGANHGLPNGYPDPLIYWTDASPKPSPIVYDARINQDPEGTLVFSNVIATDAKGYYCQAINNVVGVSQRSPKITINVEDLPPVQSPANLVASPPANAVAIRTEEHRMKCIATGYPTPEITWKRGEEQLQSGGRVTIDETGQELVISAVENSDRGTYTCVATNDGGTDEFSSILTVESAPYFPAPPSDETKGPGESVSIECRADGVPPPTVDVLVNGQPWADFQSNIDAARWTVVTGNNKLATISITNLQTTDSNVFQCIATNKYREELTSVVLNVVSIPARITSFTPTTRRLKVLQEDSATFICHVEGRPTPTVTWTFKGSVLANGDKYSIDDVEGRLVITNTVEGDSGEYECIAENAIDGVDYSVPEEATLTVLGKTTIDTPPTDLTIREGVTGTFMCEITYDQELDKPEVYWMKDGQRLEASQDNSLRIPNAMFDNSGTYTCVVKTTVDANAGTVQMVNASAVLTVQGRPDPPRNVELRTKEQEFAMDLFWDPSNDNNAPVQYYIIQYDTKWPDMRWQFQANETANPETPQYRKVVHLQPFVDYQFRVIAVNDIGRSEPSAPVAPTVDPQVAPPSKNPTGVSGSSDNPESMVIRWTAIHPFYYGGDDFRYEVAYRPKGSDEPYVTDRVNPDNTDDSPAGVTQNYIVDAMKPYDPFEFSVRSVNSAGPGPDPEIHYGFSGEAAPDAAPSGVTVEAISATEVNVTWEPISSDDANGQLLGYNVYYNVRIASGQDKLTCTKSPCVVGNLQAATTYEITVRAFTSAGEGPASDTVTVVTDSAPPGPVYDLKVQAFSYRLVVDWKKPTLTNGNLLGYRLKITPVIDDDTLGEEEVFEFQTDEPLTKRYNADPQTKYRVEVLAYNEMGDGQDSVEEPTTALEGRPAKPGAPTLVGEGLNHANFTWDLLNLSPTASHVEIQYKKKDDAEFQNSEQVDVLDKDTIMVSGLESSTEYNARLRVTNKVGSTISSTTDFKTAGADTQVDNGFVLGTWMIILICIIILLILILLIICIIKSQKGGKYNVSDKEKQLNKDIESTPLKDDGGFDEYKPPTGADGEPLRGSQGSLNDSEHGSSETDSLKEYADGETGKFDEEGSFIGQYGDNKKQRPADEEQGGGAAYSTFV